MKKRWLFLALAVLLALPLCACGRSADPTPSESADPTAQDPAALPESDEATLEARLRARCPEYFDLETGKGLELYVWQMAEGSYRCGLLPGTNRIKTEKEIWNLIQNSTTVGEMNVILNSYGIPRENVFVMPIHHPFSSYWYEIDEAYTAAVRAMFE